MTCGGKAAEGAVVGHIIITHLRGSKVNQVEQLSLDGPQEFSFGQDPNAAITLRSRQRRAR
jgi:hypothetical protein